MRTSRCWGVPLAVLTLALSFAPGPPASHLALAAPRASAVAPGCYGGEIFDFNDDQHTDVAIGEPRGRAGSVDDAGSVEVRYGCGALAPQQLRLPHPHRGDRFGAALAQGFYDDGNGSGARVLFVGVPYLDVDGHENAGGVAEFHSSSDGLTLFRVLTQATRGVPGKVQGGAHFGAALSLSDVNEETFFLRIGEPGKNVGHVKDTGGVVTLGWAEDPDQAPGDVETTVSHFGVAAQDGDLFGSSLADGDTNLVGAPGRTVDGHPGAGAVFEDAEPRLVDRDTPGVAGTPGTGDHFGAALTEGWIGVPGASVGSVEGAGVVQSWDPDRPSSSTTVSQDTAGIPGVVGVDHAFGSALAYDAAFADAGGPDADDLFVGAPGDRSGVGSVTMLRLPSDGPLIGSAVSLPGADQAGGHLGTSVAVSGVYRVLVGAPGAGGGRVYSYRLAAGSSAAPILGTSWTRASGAGTGYGGTLSGPFVDE